MKALASTRKGLLHDFCYPWHAADGVTVFCLLGLGGVGRRGREKREQLTAPVLATGRVDFKALEGIESVRECRP